MLHYFKEAPPPYERILVKELIFESNREVCLCYLWHLQMLEHPFGYYSYPFSSRWSVSLNITFPWIRLVQLHICFVSKYRIVFWLLDLRLSLSCGIGPPTWTRWKGFPTVLDKMGISRKSIEMLCGVGYKFFLWFWDVVTEWQGLMVLKQRKHSHACYGKSLFRYTQGFLVHVFVLYFVSKGLFSLIHSAGKSFVRI